MRRLLIISTMGFLLLTLAATPALAARPEREFIGGSFEFTIDAGNCAFEVVVSSEANNEYLTTFFDQSGEPVRQIISGKLFVTVTNPANGTSIDLNASGPAHIDLVTGEAFAEGLLLQWFPGSMFLHAGRYDLTINDGKGRVLLDVCEALS